MVKKNDLKKYANLLMFEMEDKEYDTLLSEFEVLLKQMDIISSFEGLDKVEPMSFPFTLDDRVLREDNVDDLITVDDVLYNCKSIKDESVMLPKVVNND